MPAVRDIILCFFSPSLRIKPAVARKLNWANPTEIAAAPKNILTKLAPKVLS